MFVKTDNNIIGISFNNQRFTVIPNFQGVGAIPSGVQNLYGTVCIIKVYREEEYEYVPFDLYNPDHTIVDDAYNAKLVQQLLVPSTDKAIGVMALAIPSVSRIITALGEATYLSNRESGEFYIYDDELWYLVSHDPSDVYPNLTSGNWTKVLLTGQSIINMFDVKVTGQYLNYYDNGFKTVPCGIETWTHTQTCDTEAGKVRVQGISSAGNTYNVLTNFNCDINTYNYSVECNNGYIRIKQTNETTGIINYFTTSYECGGGLDHQHQFRVTLNCAENCKPNVWTAVVTCDICDYRNEYETPIQCCDCDDTPEVTYICDEGTGNIRINIAESECGQAYSILTDTPCSQEDSCEKLLLLTKKDCENFNITHDNSEKTYYIKVVPYEEAFTMGQINDLVFGVNHPRINNDRPTINVDLTNNNDGMYLVYLIWNESVIDGDETIWTRYSKIIPIYKTCAMEACMNKLIKAVLCMCDCGDLFPCEPEKEAQYRYEINKLIAIIQPVQQMMMLRVAMDGQVIPYDLSLLNKYYDLGLMIKKMNLMIDRCGLCNEEELDCGCNER
jgi:hypothetical protein